jgi:hypothetical protein
MTLTPSQIQLEAQALYDELYAIFSRSPSHKAVMDTRGEIILAALAQKLQSGWVPKKGFRTVTRARTPEPVPELSWAEARRILAHAVEVHREHTRAA